MMDSVNIWQLFWLKYGLEIIGFCVIVAIIILLMLVWLGLKIYMWIWGNKKYDERQRLGIPRKTRKHKKGKNHD